MTEQTDLDARPTRRRFRSYFRNVEIDIAAVCLFLFIALSAAQVVSRYFLNSPLPWVEEVSAIILIWMTFIGSAWLVRKDQHVRVELLDEICGQRVRLVMHTVYDTISIVFLLLLAVGGYQLIDNMRFDRTPALQIPYSYIVVIVPITALLMAAYFLWGIFVRFRAQFSGNER
ncbi:TRAP transporter small permease [Amorphus sp. 3PC139-8]|uniref:TRAP transporter small permease n=1 Tax=Amorphus sp. 3PC139-8 TaxID=2735676 RepID=UPI00345D6204